MKRFAKTLDHFLTTGVSFHIVKEIGCGMSGAQSGKDELRKLGKDSSLLSTSFYNVLYVAIWEGVTDIELLWTPKSKNE